MFVKIYRGINCLFEWCSAPSSGHDVRVLYDDANSWEDTRRPSTDFGDAEAVKYWLAYRYTRRDF